MGVHGVYDRVIEQQRGNQLIDVLAYTLRSDFRAFSVFRSLADMYSRLLAVGFFPVAPTSLQQELAATVESGSLWSRVVDEWSCHPSGAAAESA